MTQAQTIARLRALEVRLRAIEHDVDVLCGLCPQDGADMHLSHMRGAMLTAVSELQMIEHDLTQTDWSPTA
jgi:hypothetical protein